MLTLQELGAEIRTARKFRQIRQADLAARAGLSRSTLSDLERGSIAELGYGKLMVLLALVGLDLKVMAANSGRPTLEDLTNDDQGME